MKIFIAFILLVGLVVGQLPSDLIVKQPAPTCIDLRNTAPASANAINDLNEPLKAWKPIDIDDLGHYFSDHRLEIMQGNESGVPTNIINFSESATSPFPISIDTVPGNENETINISEGEQGLIFW